MGDAIPKPSENLVDNANRVSPFESSAQQAYRPGALPREFESPNAVDKFLKGMRVPGEYSAKDIANDMRDGSLSGTERIEVENAFKEAHKKGGPDAAKVLIKEINDQLKECKSPIRLDSGATSIKSISAEALYLHNQQNGDRSRVADFDMSDKPRPPVAAGIADGLKHGDFSYTDRVEIENAFKDAFSHGGIKAANKLRDQINEQLKENGSDDRLETGNSIYKCLFAQKLELKNTSSGDKKDVADFDLEDPLRPSVAAGIADSLRRGEFADKDKMTIDNALKAAFLKDGQKGSLELLEQINKQLEENGSEFRLAKGNSTSKGLWAIGVDLKNAKTGESRQLADLDLDDPPVRPRSRY